MSEGTPSAYFGTCLAGFLNFFVLMGPNTIAGHLSLIYTVECKINFTARLIRPIMRLLQSSKSWLPSIRPGYSQVVVKPDAQQCDNA
jgi:hypothetical protein